MGIELCVAKAMINRNPYHRPVGGISLASIKVDCLYARIILAAMQEGMNDLTWRATKRQHQPAQCSSNLRERTPKSHPVYPRPGVCDDKLAGTRPVDVPNKTLYSVPSSDRQRGLKVSQS
ncbi:uncharacterized protein BO87DRAFT_163935 [Aspergillus neoniger CBS 115656]|uniref:Uncharacterized protein n=1 Tax=Aspergillus neoniger (strain CBS 115656) TaxID=1448310 RepID=A0A318ZR07_ASPNB|nr:hypothetical protein BO87DRAFT_163935 [Aspergillus neoniger CBS 115656]PYH38222.1 hypothetical protein BO87DRAFT_163935 [Aspergillus neoniger CBS 115656]